MRIHWLAGVALLTAAVISGCAESRAYTSYQEEIGSWSYPKRVFITCKDWFLDATDIFSLELGAGETIGLNVQPMELFQVGGLYGDVMKFGWRDRGLGFYRDIRREVGISWIYYRDMRLEPIMGTSGLFERPKAFQGFPLRFNAERHWMDIGAEAGLIFGQVSAHVSPKQALDFVVSTIMLPINIVIKPPLGWIGVRLPAVDYCEDDTEARIRKKYELELIRHPEMFEPTEKMNELIRVPY